MFDSKKILLKPCLMWNNLNHLRIVNKLETLIHTSLKIMHTMNNELEKRGEKFKKWKIEKLFFVFKPVSLKCAWLALVSEKDKNWRIRFRSFRNTNLSQWHLSVRVVVHPTSVLQQLVYIGRVMIRSRERWSTMEKWKGADVMTGYFMARRIRDLTARAILPTQEPRPPSFFFFLSFFFLLPFLLLPREFSLH